MGLLAKIHVKINRETLWPRIRNVDQITGWERFHFGNFMLLLLADAISAKGRWRQTMAGATSWL
jgi:hypothetical protein